MGKTDQALAIPRLAEVSATREAAQNLNPAQLYVASLLSDQSRVAARSALGRITRILGWEGAWDAFPWEELGAGETTLIRTVLVRDYAPTTARQALSMLKGVLREAFRLGLMSADTYHRAILLPSVRAETAPAGRMLSEGEVTALGAYMRQELSGARRALAEGVFAAGLGGGLRREEFCTLDPEALSSDNTALLVHGKGRRERVQPLPAWAGAALRSWRALRGDGAAAFFVQVSPDGDLRLDAPFSLWGMWSLIRQTGEAAGVAHFTPHDLRRTYCSRMLDRADLAQTQRLMGHKNATTTLRYDRRDSRKAEAAAATLEGWGLGEAYWRAGKPLDRAWARTQIVELRKRGFADRKIARALEKVGVSGPSGELSQADVESLGR